ncbi:hypothetical protein [Roseobacter sinensis]|uniref:Uncharacterized protein n=1 Tax=Roseobacter sinensis TaxID=2931391 RepID=A0ABT3BJH8_9RHOB|nr:hypothetical protein [Roseobacter sp. WL0113]MCV3273727.1 hypothetical protein [Roseobacter sp. WL0113]
MSKFATDRKAIERKSQPVRRSSGRHEKSDPALDALQAKADGSLLVAQLRHVQSRATGVVQREVDTSSSPSLGRGDPNYEYPLPARDGVPKWAAEEYEDAPDRLPITGSANDYYATGTLPWDKSGDVTEETKAEFNDPHLTLMCSTDNGKIGSIYFEGGRVRTTHKSGPTTSKHPADRTFQYNIDRDAAWDRFVKSGGKRRILKAERKKPKADRVSENRLFNRWIAQQLKGKKVKATPAWAKLLESPDDAFETPAEADASKLKLFEVMLKPNTKIQSKHPSRGAATQIVIKRSDLEKLKGVGQLMSGEKDPRTANELFYEYVRKHIPDLLKFIRHPSEIKY